MARQTYKLAYHPTTRKLWVLGYCGGGHYMAMVQVKDRAEGEKTIAHYLRAENSARGELLTTGI